MICNGINFNDEWVLKFKNAEEFSQHPTCQRYISLGKVEEKTLLLFYSLVADKHKTKADGNINKDVPAAVPEVESESSDRGNGEGEERSDSRPAGNTDEPGRKGRRKQVS